SPEVRQSPAAFAELVASESAGARAAAVTALAHLGAAEAERLGAAALAGARTPRDRLAAAGRLAGDLAAARAPVGCTRAVAQALANEWAAREPLPLEELDVGVEGAVRVELLV